MRKRTNYATISSTNDSQIIRFRSPIDWPKNERLPKPLMCTFGMRGEVARRAVVAVDLDEEVAGDAEREEVDRRAADDLVGAKMDREERVHEREAAPATAAVTRPISHEPNLSAPRQAKNAPASIIPSRPMFTTPLRSETMPPTAAYASGVAQASVEPMSAPHETTDVRWSFDEFVARTPSPMPMMPHRDRAPAHPAHAARHRPDAARDREQPDEQRHELRVRVTAAAA